MKEEPKINVQELMDGLIEIRSVCSMGMKQANAMIMNLNNLIQQSQQVKPVEEKPVIEKK